MVKAGVSGHAVIGIDASYRCGGLGQNRYEAAMRRLAPSGRPLAHVGLTLIGFGHRPPPDMAGRFSLHHHGYIVKSASTASIAWATDGMAQREESPKGGGF
jgi:hypothetical protein